eukprot:g4640.t1
MGNFFSRPLNGESSADVFDRVSLFFHTLWRDFRSHPEMENQIVLIVTHGLAMRVALMKWLNWNVTKFSRMRNPDNCDFLNLVRYLTAATSSIVNKRVSERVL